MKLYHGTNAVIEQINIAQSRVGKDFGIGFYLTPDYNVASRQAERKLEQHGFGKAHVYAFDFDETSASELKTLRFDSYSLEWSQFVFMNRRNRTRLQVHDYDIVVGPIADDVVGYQIRRVEEGIISEEQFLEEIKYHKVTMQYLFGTAKSIKMLKRI